MNRAGLPAGVSSLRLAVAGRLQLLLLVAAMLLIAGCASTPPQPDTYTVRRGDTLYSIAWRHGLNYRDVARWNGIGSNYVIYPGQKLRLHPSGGAPARTAGRPAATTPAPRTTSPPATGGARPAAPARPPGPPVAWQWPVTGGTATLTTRPNGGHGLTIAGRQGSDIRAAGPGSVVYTGTGLLGYGQLVIIKHNDTYLSAYGHLQTVLVSEGASVNAGQRIASMGQGPQGSPMLYFEIRVQGTPSNPLVLLPQR